MGGGCSCPSCPAPMDYAYVNKNIQQLKSQLGLESVSLEKLVDHSNVAHNHTEDFLKSLISTKESKTDAENMEQKIHLDAAAMEKKVEDLIRQQNETFTAMHKQEQVAEEKHAQMLEKKLQDVDASHSSVEGHLYDLMMLKERAFLSAYTNLEILIQQQNEAIASLHNQQKQLLQKHDTELKDLTAKHDSEMQLLVKQMVGSFLQASNDRKAMQDVMTTEIDQLRNGLLEIGVQVDFDQKEISSNEETLASIESQIVEDQMQLNATLNDRMEEVLEHSRAFSTGLSVVISLVCLFVFVFWRAHKANRRFGSHKHQQELTLLIENKEVQSGSTPQRYRDEPPSSLPGFDSNSIGTVWSVPLSASGTSSETLHRGLGKEVNSGTNFGLNKTPVPNRTRADLPMAGVPDPSVSTVSSGDKWHPGYWTGQGSNSET